MVCCRPCTPVFVLAGFWRQHPQCSRLFCCIAVGRSCVPRMTLYLTASCPWLVLLCKQKALHNGRRWHAWALQQRGGTTSFKLRRGQGVPQHALQHGWRSGRCSALQEGDVCQEAAESGSVSPQQLRDRRAPPREHPPHAWDEQVCDAAAEAGHMAVLQWLRSQQPPCPFGPGSALNPPACLPHECIPPPGRRLKQPDLWCNTPLLLGQLRGWGRLPPLRCVGAPDEGAAQHSTKAAAAVTRRHNSIRVTRAIISGSAGPAHRRVPDRTGRQLALRRARWLTGGSGGAPDWR